MAYRLFLYRTFLHPLPFVLQMHIIRYITPSITAFLETGTRHGLWTHFHDQYCNYCGNPLERHPDRPKRFSFHLSCYYRSRRIHRNGDTCLRADTDRIPHYQTRKANVYFSFCPQHTLGKPYHLFFQWDNLYIPLYLVCKMHQRVYYHRIFLTEHDCHIQSMINLYNFNIYSNSYITLVPVDFIDFYRQQRLLSRDLYLLSFYPHVNGLILQLCLQYPPLLNVFKTNILQNISFFIPLCVQSPRSITQWMIHHCRQDRSQLLSYLSEFPMACEYMSHTLLRELWEQFPSDIGRLYRQHINLSCILEFY